jgi:hypothetical protein
MLLSIYWMRLNDSIMLCHFQLYLSLTCFFFVILISRLPEEDHRSGKIIQVHQGRGYYDRRGMNHCYLFDYCIEEFLLLVIPTFCAIQIFRELNCCSNQRCPCQIGKYYVFKKSVCKVQQWLILPIKQGTSN